MAWTGRSGRIIRCSCCALRFDHLLLVAIGVAMVVLVLESARARSEELNDKMRRLTLLIAASTQTLSVKEVLDQVLGHLVESLGATHGLVRLAEGQGDAAQLMARASVGSARRFWNGMRRCRCRSRGCSGSWRKNACFFESETSRIRRHGSEWRKADCARSSRLSLPGKEGPLGIIAVGSTQHLKFQADEISYLGNVANLLGLTLQNVRLFEQVATVQQQWAYTFDSIGDPILVHDREFRILRSNQRLSAPFRPRRQRARGTRGRRFAGAEERALRKLSVLRRSRRARATRPIHGCRDISWRRIRRLPIRRGGNWARFTC